MTLWYGITGSVVPGAGAFEIAAHAELTKYKDTVKGRSRLGYLLFCWTASEYNSSACCVHSVISLYAVGHKPCIFFRIFVHTGMTE